MARRLRLLWVGGLLLAGCGLSPRQETYEVGPQKVPCMAVGPWLCLEVTKAGAGERMWHYDGIHGFEFRWGVIQTVKVRIETVPNPPQDSSSESWHLEETLSTTPVPEGTTFELALTNEYLTGDQAEGFKLLYAEPLACATESVCTALAQRRGGPPRGALTLVVRPPSPPDTAPVVESVR
jgi:hypothetical protein